MFWNKKKKKDESEEDLPEYTEDITDEDDVSESDDVIDKTKDDDDSYDEDGKEDFDIEEYFENEETDEDSKEETVESASSPAVTVTVKVSSLNSLAEFVSLRNPVNLQFMRKGTDEVFELREAHLRIAKVWGSVSMSRECSEAEYAKIMLAIELLENPDDFYVLPALTETDLKSAMEKFCEEKYSEKNRRAATNPKKFARLIEENGDKEEWKLFLRELLYKKTEDFCNENGIGFSESDEEGNDE